MPHPEYYRQISAGLFTELVQLLQERSHVALFGPRQGGKAIVLTELQSRAERMPQPERPRIAWLASNELARHSEDHFIEAVARILDVERVRSRPGASHLSGRLEALYRKAIARHRCAIWIFVQNVLGFSSLVARELLHSFQLCHEDPKLRPFTAVVVTGGCDFLPLTYGPLSPYRHASKLLITGLDRECAAAYLHSRLVPHRDAEFSEQIDREAFEYLHVQTEGNPHFLQEIVLTAARHPHTLRPTDLPEKWTLQDAHKHVRVFVTRCMVNDYFARLSLRDLERRPAAFDIILEILRKGDGTVVVPGGGLQDLEASGIVHRDHALLGSIAHPIWRRFLGDFLDHQHVADVYARQKRWHLAWAEYPDAPVHRERPVAGEDRYRLRAVLSDWEASLEDCIFNGQDAVCQQFYLGAWDLLGFDAAELFDQSSASSGSLFPDGFGLEDARRFVPAIGEGPVYVDREEGISYWLDGPRQRLFSDPGQTLTSAPNVRPALFMERKGMGRAIDSAEQTYLWKALRRFWHAYFMADQVAYRKGIGDLREKHLKVIEQVNRLLAEEPFDMLKLVQGAANSLVHTAGYFRILICLVDAKRKFIQAVASHCREPALNFDYVTNFPLDLAVPAANRDVQPWVVLQGEHALIRDASDPTQFNPTTQHAEAAKLEMKAITVVPMKIQDLVLGTIHFERDDRRTPSPGECELFNILAGQLAVTFHQAQRMTLLNKAVSALSDRITLVDPLKQVIFLNDASLAEHPGRDPGWQQEPFAYTSSLGPDAGHTLIDEIEAADKPMHHYQIPGEGSRGASDWFIAPIDDFRAQLTSHFKADGRIGYVERVHDLTELYTLYNALQLWLAETGVLPTARKIIRFFEGQDFTWGRLYLLKKLPWDDRDVLVSLEEFGLTTDERQRFLAEEWTFAKEDLWQPWHAMTMIKPHTMAIYEHKADLLGNEIRPAPPFQGFPRYWTSGEADPFRAYKDSPQWIEAPLFVGKKAVGLLSLSLPSGGLTPEHWELLRSAVLGVAVALHDVLRADEEARRAEAASREAAALAVHQLTHKISPLESWLVYALEDLESSPDTARKSLQTATHTLREAREILTQFKRFASDAPFSEKSLKPVPTFLADIADTIQSHLGAAADVKLTGGTPQGWVEVNWESMREAFQLLADNTQKHSEASRIIIKLTARAIGTEEAGYGETDLVRIEYWDNGVGIAPNNLDKVFRPYYTTSATGSGLGLTLVLRNVRRNGGKIIALSGSAGAGFAIDLPLKAPRRHA